MLYYVYFSDQGLAKTGLSCTWEYLLTGENATDKSGAAPSITEVGGGWYKFDITFGSGCWDVTTEDLVGVIDGGAALDNIDRYKPVCISLRGLGLARIAHKGVQSKMTGDIDIYATDGATKELKLEMADGSETISRNPTAAS